MKETKNRLLDSSMSPEEALASLERRLRRLTVVVHLMVAICSLLFLAGWRGIQGGTLLRETSLKQGVHMDSRGIYIYDKNGRQRISLGIWDAGPGLWFMDEKGKLRAIFDCHGDPHLTMFTPKGEVAVGLVGRAEAFIEVLGAKEGTIRLDHARGLWRKSPK